MSAVAGLDRAVMEAFDLPPGVTELTVRFQVGNIGVVTLERYCMDGDTLALKAIAESYRLVRIEEPTKEVEEWTE